MLTQSQCFRIFISHHTKKTHVIHMIHIIDVFNIQLKPFSTFMAYHKVDDTERALYVNVIYRNR